LNKSYPTRNGTLNVLRDITFHAKTSEFVSIIGPSGCGKTTLLRVLAGLTPRSSGDVLVEGEPLEGPGADRGMVFQDFSLFPWATVKENIAFGPSLRGKSEKEKSEVVEYYMTKFELQGFEDYLPGQISHGMQQRAAIARALANDPRILLMDEPFGSLDAYTRTTIQDFIMDVIADLKRTTLFVTHDIYEAIYMSDRVIVLSNRPATIIAQIPVRLPWPRVREMTFNKRFQEMVMDIRALLSQWQASPGEA
jgi:ABC-type nitrate/sulfonate/bicarbonate transport system ATPase subunit